MVQSGSEPAPLQLPDRTDRMSIDHPVDVQLVDNTDDVPVHVAQRVVVLQDGEPLNLPLAKKPLRFEASDCEATIVYLPVMVRSVTTCTTPASATADTYTALMTE